MHCVTEVTVTSLGDLQRKNRGVNDCAIPLHFIRCTTDGAITWPAELAYSSEGWRARMIEVALHAMHCVADRAITWTVESNGEIPDGKPDAPV